MSNSTARARKALRAREAAGGRCIRVILSPAAARALGRLTTGASITAAVESSLLAASPPTPEADAAGFLSVVQARMGD